MKLLILPVLVALLGFLLSADDNTCPSDKSLTDEIVMLKKQFDVMRAGVTQRDQQITVLKLMVSQKDAQIQFYMACAGAGLLPDGTCNVDFSNLTVTKKADK